MPKTMVKYNNQRSIFHCRIIVWGLKLRTAARQIGKLIEDVIPLKQTSIDHWLRRANFEAEIVVHEKIYEPHYRRNPQSYCWQLSHLLVDEQSHLWCHQHCWWDHFFDEWMNTHWKCRKTVKNFYTTYAQFWTKFIVVLIVWNISHYTNIRIIDHFTVYANSTTLVKCRAWL